MQLCDGKCQTQNALQSDVKVQDLFLELKSLRSQLQLLEDFLFYKAKDDLSNQLPSSPFSGDAQWLSLKEYRNHLIEVLRDKKRKIRQARELQRYLRRKHRPESGDVKKLIKDLVLPSDMTPRFDAGYVKSRGGKIVSPVIQTEESARFDRGEVITPVKSNLSTVGETLTDSSGAAQGLGNKKDKEAASGVGTGDKKASSKSADAAKSAQTVSFMSKKSKIKLTRPNILLRDNKSKLPPDKAPKRKPKKLRDEL